MKSLFFFYFGLFINMQAIVWIEILHLATSQNRMA